jgi:Ohr subfamily peroxiredoxin
MARDPIYTAHAHVTGGRIAGHGEGDSGLAVDLRTPTEMGGEGGGTNPEELFAVGYAACFESALGLIARRARQEIGEVSVESSVHLIPVEDRSLALGVELDVTLPDVHDPAVAADLVRSAHRVCPYSNATRGNIEVTLIANGERLS